MFVLLGKRLHSSVLENHARFFFFENLGLFFFLLNVDVSHYVKPCKVFVFLKPCNVFFVAKGIFVCKTMQCLLFKIKEFFFFGKTW